MDILSKYKAYEALIQYLYDRHTKPGMVQYWKYVEYFNTVTIA